MHKKHKFWLVSLKFIGKELLNTKMINFNSESHDMTIFGKGHTKKWSNSIDITIIFNICPKSLQVIVSKGSCHELSRKISFT